MAGLLITARIGLTRRRLRFRPGWPRRVGHLNSLYSCLFLPPADFARTGLSRGGRLAGHRQTLEDRSKRPRISVDGTWEHSDSLRSPALALRVGQGKTGSSYNRAELAVVSFTVFGSRPSRPSPATDLPPRATMAGLETTRAGHRSPK